VPEVPILAILVERISSTLAWIRRYIVLLSPRRARRRTPGRGIRTALRSRILRVVRRVIIRRELVPPSVGDGLARDVGRARGVQELVEEAEGEDGEEDGEGRGDEEGNDGCPRVSLPCTVTPLLGIKSAELLCPNGTKEAGVDDNIASVDTGACVDDLGLLDKV